MYMCHMQQSKQGLEIEQTHAVGMRDYSALTFYPFLLLFAGLFPSYVPQDRYNSLALNRRVYTPILAC